MTWLVRDELKEWVATNLLRGCSVESIEQGLINAGVSADAARRELIEAQQNPYLRGARSLQAKLARRESLLKTLDWQLRLTAGYTQIERQPLPRYVDFLSAFYLPNRPGLFTGAVDHWPARHWTPETLVSRAGADTIVQVQRGREALSAGGEYESRSDQLRTQMSLGDLGRAIAQAKSSNDFYLTANNQALANPGMAALLEDIGELGDGYLSADRLPQDVHLWFGPRGVRTPLHHDLTNNLFVQIHGRKRFRLVPALQAPWLGNDKHVYSPLDLAAPDLNAFPDAAKLTVLDIEVGPGELLFIPAGWWHQVEGLDASISLSFTTVNLPFNGFIEFPG